MLAAGVQSSEKGFLIIDDGLRKERRIGQQVLTGTTTSSSKQQQYGSGYYLDHLATFSVVIAGEYNDGKSTLINALLARKLLDTGSLPTTDCITIHMPHHHHHTEITTTLNSLNSSFCYNCDKDKTLLKKIGLTACDENCGFLCDANSAFVTEIV
jgi:septin family protein